MIEFKKGNVIMYSCGKCGLETDNYKLWWNHTLNDKNCDKKKVELD
jgi:hypothetical protein